MSMINDALRRASNVTAPQPLAESGAAPPPLPSGGFNTFTELPPLVEQPPAKKTSLPLLLLALFLFCAAAAAGVYLWERSRTPVLPKKDAKGQIVASVVPAPKVADAPTTAKPATVAAAATATAAPAAAPQKAAAAPVSTAPAAVPAANVTFPQLRLQSIYYKPASPSVMINGRTLYVNDQVQGVTVAAIDPSSVTLVLSGRTNVLTLR